RVALAGLLEAVLELLRVRHAVDEAEPVLRDQVDEHLDEGLGIRGQRDPVAARQREVEAAGLADPVARLELLAEQHLPAALALDPESAGHVFLLAEPGPGHPGHLAVSGVVGQHTGGRTGIHASRPRSAAARRATSPSSWHIQAEIRSVDAAP